MPGPLVKTSTYRSLDRLPEQVARLASERAAESVKGPKCGVLVGRLQPVQRRAAEPKPPRHLDLADARLLSKFPQPLREPLGESHEDDGRRGSYPLVGRSR
jgi:hypothetical protein